MVRFTPLSPARLVTELAAWVERRSPGRATVIGFDGPAEIGLKTLADNVAESLRASGRQVVRASTGWWWRPAALRLEFGWQDADMLLTGWVDAEAMRRELIEPVVAGGRPYITRLRDPDTDRSVRQSPETAPPGAAVLLDGPFLLAAELPLDGLVGLGVSRGALGRALPADRQWWPPVFERYGREYRAAERADVLLSYDHASAPAAAGLDVGRFI